VACVRRLVEGVRVFKAEGLEGLDAASAAGSWLSVSRMGATPGQLAVAAMFRSVLEGAATAVVYLVGVLQHWCCYRQTCTVLLGREQLQWGVS
jgi:hypothetical protein